MKRFLTYFFISIFLFSCTESDDSQNNSIEPDANFFALTVGNSWVYKNYKYNAATETYEDTGVVDNVSIVGTEVLAGETFYKFRRFTTGNEEKITFCNPNGEHFSFLRESDGNLIDEKGAIKFSRKNYNERLIQENPWGTIYEILVQENTTLSVEAGEFDCIYSERYAKNTKGKQMSGLDRFYYANGVGLIYDTSSYVNDPMPSIIRRLDVYQIQ